MTGQNLQTGLTMFNIYRHSGLVAIALPDIPEGAVVHRELMGDHYCKVKFTLSDCIILYTGDYIENSFGRFELTSGYKPKYNEQTSGYDYELQFDAYYFKFSNKMCKYLPYSTSNETSFNLTSTIDVHLGVIIKNINTLCEKDASYKYNGNNYSFALRNFPADKVNTSRLVQYNSLRIIDAIGAIADAFECEWWFEDNIIYVGKCELSGSTNFSQGVNVADLKSSESSQAFANRIFAFGSTRNIPSNYRASSSADLTKDGVVQKRLMLPVEDCPYGYVEEAGITETQAVEAVFVDEDIYPRTRCVVDEVTTYTDTTTDEETGETITEIFYRITDKSGFNFNTDMILPGETLHILFQSGSLNGMDFECYYSDSQHYYEIVVNENYGRKLPDDILKPKPNDTFVLYNWDSTKIAETGIIEAAENELLAAAEAKLNALKEDQSTYTCTMDSIWYEENMGSTFYDLGQKVTLTKYTQEEISSRIYGYELKLDIPYDSPVYIIGETAAYSRSKSIQSQLDALTYKGMSYTINGGGGSSIYLITSEDKTRESDYNVYSAKRTKKQFLSRLDDDTASGIITFEQGIKLVGDLISSLVKDDDEFSNSDEAIISEAKALSTFLNKHGDTATGLITFLQGIISNSVKSNDFTSGDLDGSGFGVWVDDNGKSHAEFDVLSARMKAIFTELEIKKLRYSGGNLIFSAAGGEIIRVENFSSFWRCYFKADDGEDGAVNLWDTDDLAMCRTFNLTSSGSTTLGNRYYWRRVVNAATRVVDGETLAYIDLSKSIYDTSAANDEPAVGDMVVQVGNRDNTNADRQNVILLEVVGTNAPSFKGYTNINTFSLSNDKLVFQWSPQACQVRSDRFRLLTSSNGSVSENPIVNDRGAWVSGATYAYYDRVSYNGNLWLCTNQSGTSGTPSVSSDWLLQVSKGEDGKAFNIKDKVNSVSDLPATGEEGDAYMVGYHLYVWSTIYNTYWNGWGQQDAPFSGFVSNTPITLTEGQKYKVVIDAVTTRSEFVDVAPVRSSFGNALYLAKGAEMTSGGAQATETEAFLLYPSGNDVNVYYQNTGLGNYASITVDVYEQSVGWRDMGTLRGVDGEDAYNIQLSTDNIVFDTDVNGQAILSGNNEVSVALYKGGEAVANPTISIGTTTGCTASASGSVVTINAVSASSGQVVINVSKGSDFSGSKILKFACITYQTMKSFAQEIVDDSMTNYATSERVGTLEGNVTTLSSSVSSLQQTSKNLTARVANNEGNISSLDQRAGSLETSVKSGLVNLFSDGERERSSNQGTLSIDVSSIVRSMIGYAQATYSADVMLLEGASATISLSLVVNGANKGTNTYVVQNDGAWHRISVSYAITASDVQSISSAIVNVLFAQVLEQGEVPLSYHVRHIQAQLGGIATEWQPSQADYETKFVQTPTQAGILAYTQGQEVASIGVYSDGKVKLTGEEIQLEGNITANGNVRIDENGMIHAKGGVFDGYIRSSVAKDLWYETESYGFYYHPVKSQLNLMFTYDGKVLLPSDPEYIGARVLIVGGLTNSGVDAKIDICPARSYSVRCYEFYPEGTGSDSVTWASSDNTVMSVKAPWAQATNWQIYDPIACRTILGLDMSGGSYIRMENGTIELLGVPCYKGTSDPIYKLKEDNNGTIEGRKLRENGTLDTTTTQMYSRDGEVTEWTQWVIINRSVKKLTIMQ